MQRFHRRERLRQDTKLFFESSQGRESIGELPHVFA